jgi:hypothetical protein
MLITILKQFKLMLNNININELNEQYIDYSFLSLLCGLDNPLMLILN